MNAVSTPNRVLVEYYFERTWCSVSIMYMYSRSMCPSYCSMCMSCTTRIHNTRESIILCTLVCILCIICIKYQPVPTRNHVTTYPRTHVACRVLVVAAQPRHLRCLPGLFAHIVSSFMHLSIYLLINQPQDTSHPPPDSTSPIEATSTIPDHVDWRWAAPCGTGRPPEARRGEEIDRGRGGRHRRRAHGAGRGRGGAHRD